MLLNRIKIALSIIFELDYKKNDLIIVLFSYYMLTFFLALLDSFGILLLISTFTNGNNGLSTVLENLPNFFLNFFDLKNFSMSSLILILIIIFVSLTSINPIYLIQNFFFVTLLRLLAHLYFSTKRNHN